MGNPSYLWLLTEPFRPISYVFVALFIATITDHKLHFEIFDMRWIKDIANEMLHDLCAGKKN